MIGDSESGLTQPWEKMTEKEKQELWKWQEHQMTLIRIDIFDDTTNRGWKFDLIKGSFFSPKRRKKKTGRGT